MAVISLSPAAGNVEQWLWVGWQSQQWMISQPQTWCLQLAAAVVGTTQWQLWCNSAVVWFEALVIDDWWLLICASRIPFRLSANHYCQSVWVTIYSCSISRSQPAFIYIYVAIVSHPQECKYHLRLTHVWRYNHARIWDRSHGEHLRTRSRLPTLGRSGQWWGTVSTLQEWDNSAGTSWV